MKIGIRILILTILVMLVSCTASQRQDAVKDAAKKYVTEMGYEFVGASGSTHDSATGADGKGDGHISIDVRVKDPNSDTPNKVKTLHLRCTYSYVGMATGCVEKLLVVPGRTS